SLQHFAFFPFTPSSTTQIYTLSLHDALPILNEYAPEHLILACANADDLAGQVINAGSVFLGNYSPEAVGDYAGGTNHTLPTNGRSEEHTSELQSRFDLVCRLLLEKKKYK